MCLKAGPHNSHFHKIVGIDEAYRLKLDEMKNIVGKFFFEGRCGC